jgi:hypothetical protein
MQHGSRDAQRLEREIELTFAYLFGPALQMQSVFLGAFEALLGSPAEVRAEQRPSEEDRSLEQPLATAPRANESPRAPDAGEAEPAPLRRRPPPEPWGRRPPGELTL